MNENTTDAADLARIILDDSEDEHPTAMYVLNVHEARTLASAVTDLVDKVERMEALAANLGAAALWAINHPDIDVQAHAHADRDLAFRIRAILNGGGA